MGCGKDFDALPLVKPMKIIFWVLSRDEGENMEVGRIGTFLDGASWLDASIFYEDESCTGGERQKPTIAMMASAPGDVFAKYRNVWGRSRGDVVSGR
jgi:hypothetical protein